MRQSAISSKNLKYGVVIGSSYACDLADEWGVASVLIYTRESCRNLLRKAIRHALARAEGNISGTARLLGISRPTLYDLMKAYDLQP